MTTKMFVPCLTAAGPNGEVVVDLNAMNTQRRVGDRILYGMSKADQDIRKKAVTALAQVPLHLRQVVRVPYHRYTCYHNVEASPAWGPRPVFAHETAEWGMGRLRHVLELHGGIENVPEEARNLVERALAGERGTKPERRRWSQGSGGCKYCASSAQLWAELGRGVMLGAVGRVRWAANALVDRAPRS